MAKTPQDRLSKIRGKKPIATTLYIPLEDGLDEPVDEAKNELGRARILQDVEREAAAVVLLKQAEENLRENSVRFHFEGIGRVAFEDMLREHEPTAAQKTKAEADGEDITWNTDTFPAAIIAATLRDPVLSEQEVKDEILDASNWGPNEIGLIFNAAVEVNTRRRVASLGN